MSRVARSGCTFSCFVVKLSKCVNVLPGPGGDDCSTRCPSVSVALPCLMYCQSGFSRETGKQWSFFLVCFLPHTCPVRHRVALLAVPTTGCSCSETPNWLRWLAHAAPTCRPMLHAPDPHSASLSPRYSPELYCTVMAAAVCREACFGRSLSHVCPLFGGGGGGRMILLFRLHTS